MLNDIEGTFLISIFFSVLLFTPGFVVAWLTDIFSFRSASFSERIPVAVCLSVCLSPIILNLLAREFSVRACSTLFLLGFAAFLFVVAFEWRRRPRIFPLPRYTLAGFGMACLISVVLLLSFVDLQIGSRLYPTVAVYDHGVRTAFIESAVRSGAPPANPFFYPGSPVLSRYYYFWYVLCAVPVALTGGDPRVSLYASSLWSALALASLVPIYLKHFLNERESLHRKSLIGIALLAVTGFDLIPTFLWYRIMHSVFSDMEAWDNSQVTSWFDAMLWVPHHVASLVACLAGFLVLWASETQKSGRQRAIHVGVAALAFSSSAGLSVYVALAFAAFLAIWTLRYLLQRRWRSFGTFASACLLTLLISLPYLNDLRRPAESSFAGRNQTATAQTTPREAPLRLEVRTTGFFPSGSVSIIPLRLVECGVLYFFEFGFYAFVAVIVFRSQGARRRQLSEAQRAARYLLLTVGLLATFVRSSVISNNDFGWRSMMLVQFVLLLWGALLIDELWFQRIETRVLTKGLSTGSKAMLLGALALGLAGTLYQIAMSRTTLLLADLGRLNVHLLNEPEPPNIGSDTYGYRAAFESLDKQVPLTGLVQYNPFASDLSGLLVYNRYQTAVGDAGCALPFGGSEADCEVLKQKLVRIFPRDATPAASNRELDQLCSELKIQVLIAHRSDPLWGRHGSWVWERTPFIANQAIRMFRCGTSQASIPSTTSPNPLERSATAAPSGR